MLRVWTSLLISTCVFVCDTPAAFAFQTRVINSVPPGTPITVTEPTIRTLWYDETRGVARTYDIVSVWPFRLYVALRTNEQTEHPAFVFSVRELSKGVATPHREIVTFSGDQSEWTRVYEWVDGKLYQQSAIVDIQAPPGHYRVEVVHPRGGHYQLVTGTEYDVTRWYEFVATLARLPAITLAQNEPPHNILKSPFLIAFFVILGLMFLGIYKLYVYTTTDRAQIHSRGR